jgi:hypothetical protein
MQVTEDGAGSKAEQLAHARPAVERWLSRSGLVPLPVFLVLHLLRELRLAFVGDVSEVLRPAPGLLALATSWLLVWLPLLVHVGLAVDLLLSGRRLGAPAGGDLPALARLVSRVTALLALLFVLYHGRSYGFAVWAGEADARDAGFRLLAELSSTKLGVPLASGAYLLGLLATVTHAGISVHRALAAEGLLATAARRHRSARLCTALAVLSFAAGAVAAIRVASGVFLR